MGETTPVQRTGGCASKETVPALSRATFWAAELGRRRLRAGGGSLPYIQQHLQTGEQQ